MLQELVRPVIVPRVREATERYSQPLSERNVGHLLERTPAIWESMYQSETPAVFKTVDELNPYHVWHAALINATHDDNLREQLRDIHNFNPNFFVESTMDGIVSFRDMKKGIMNSGYDIDTGKGAAELRAYMMIGDSPFASREITISEAFMAPRTIQEWHHHRFNDEIIIGLEGTTTCLIRSADGDVERIHLEPGQGVTMLPHTEHTLLNNDETFTRHVALKYPIVEFRDRIAGSSEKPRIGLTLFDFTNPTTVETVGVSAKVHLADIEEFGDTLPQSDLPQGLLITNGTVAAEGGNGIHMLSQHSGIWVKPGKSFGISGKTQNTKVLHVSEENPEH